MKGKFYIQKNHITFSNNNIFCNNKGDNYIKKCNLA